MQEEVVGVKTLTGRKIARDPLQSEGGRVPPLPARKLASCLLPDSTPAAVCFRRCSSGVRAGEAPARMQRAGPPRVARAAAAAEDGGGD